jgi:hypothetical protein
VVKLNKEHLQWTVPKSVETSHKGKVTTLWTQQMKTGRTIPNNKPDIITRVHEKETCLPIHNAHRNVIKQEAQTILQYKDLIREIQRMLKVKTNRY